MLPPRIDKEFLRRRIGEYADTKGAELLANFAKREVVQAQTR